MSLIVGNCKVLYLRVLVSDPTHNEPVILQLAAKLGKKSHFNWVKPPAEKLMGTIAAEYGLKRKSSYLMLWDDKIRTTSLNSAMIDLYSLMKSQQPILLVTYSTKREMELFFEAVRKTNSVSWFGDMIKGVVNTLPIFEKHYPDLYRSQQVDLPILAQYALKRNCSIGYFDSLRYLEVLDKLVTTFISSFELNENRKSWKEFFPDTYSIMAQKRDLLKKSNRAIVENKARSNENDLFKRPPRDHNQLLINQNRRRNTSNSFAAQHPEFLRKIRQRINDAAFGRESDDFNPESSGSLVEEEVPVPVQPVLFRDGQNLYDQLIINEDRRRNTSNSIAAQQQGIPRKIYQRNNDVAFEREPGNLNPESGSLAVEQVPVQQVLFRDGQDLYDQLIINEDRRRNTSNSFAAQQQGIPRKIYRRNNDVAFGREPGNLNPESGSLAVEQVPVQQFQFQDPQDLYDQLIINEDRRRNTSNSFAAQQQGIPRKIYRRNNDVAFGREPGNLNPESGSLAVEQVPVQQFQFQDSQDLYNQLLINQDRRRNTSNSFAAPQQGIPREIYRRHNDYYYPFRR